METENEILATEGADNMNFFPIMGTKYFVEVTRSTATDAVVDIYTSSDYSTTLVDTRSMTIGAGLVNLRYLYIGVWTGSSANTTADLDITKIEGVKDGVTTW